MLTGVNTKPSSGGKTHPYLACKYNKLIVEMSQYLKSIFNRIVKKKLLWTINVHKKEATETVSNFFKNSFDGVNFKESCMTCNFRSKSLYGYLS